jgi:hypothetical protein
LKFDFEAEEKLEKITLKLNRESKNSSVFIKKGEYLKEYKNDPLFDFHNFEFLKLGDEFHVIGSGATGEVFLTRNKKNHKYYAIKKVIEKKYNNKIIKMYFNTKFYYFLLKSSDR